MSLTGDLTSPAQLRPSLWFVTSRLCIRLVAPLPAVRHSSASSLHAACLCYLILRLWCASTTPAVLYSKLSPCQICEPGCLYDLDLMPNNSDDNCISHQSLAQQQHRIVGVDLVDSEGDLVMAEGRDSV